MVIRVVFSIALVIGLLPGLVMAQKTLQADVDRNLVEIGDIIQLSVMANFQTISQGPDFEQLKPEFEVLGVQASSQLRVINGQFTGTTQWDAQILATRTGSLRIPSFEVDGIVSSPIEIQVSESTQPQADYKLSFLEAEVDNANPYVQSQVIYTLRYYHLGQLIRGNIEPPTFNGALNERLKNQQTFERRVNGRVYRVYEWVYALFPQSSGELIIPGQTFEGTLLQNRQLRLVKEQSDTLKLQVKPIPQSYPKNATWLPAKSLTLKQQWSQQQDLKVGDTISRSLHLEAVGLKSGQLPDLAWASQGGYRLYKDPVSQNDHLSERGLSSSKAQDFMMVIEQAGEISFPEIKMAWWNTETDQIEWATLPSTHFKVQTNPQINLGFQPENTPPQTVEQQNHIWFWVSWVFISLWLITLGLYIKVRTSKSITQPQTTHDELAQPAPSSSNTIEDLLRRDDQQLYAQLQPWLKQHYQIQDLQQLKTLSPPLYMQIMALEHRLFAPEKSSDLFNRERFRAALKDLANNKTSNQHHSALAEIYPKG